MQGPALSAELEDRLEHSMEPLAWKVPRALEIADELDYAPDAEHAGSEHRKLLKPARALHAQPAP